MTPWTAVRQASLSITNSQSLLKLMSIESVMPSHHLILCCPLLLPSSIFPASGSFQMSQLFASGGLSIGVSASGPVLLKSIHGWFSLILTGLISLQSKGPSRVFSSTTVRKLQFFNALLSLLSCSHIHTWLLDRLVCQLYLNKTGEKRNRKGDTTQGPAQAGHGGDLKQDRSRPRMGGDGKVERWLESGFGPDPVTGWRWSPEDGGARFWLPLAVPFMEEETRAKQPFGKDAWHSIRAVLHLQYLEVTQVGLNQTGRHLGAWIRARGGGSGWEWRLEFPFYPTVGGPWNDQSCHPPSCTRGPLILFLFFLATSLSLWDLSSSTRDQTWAPGSESTESQPQDHWGIPLLKQDQGSYGPCPPFLLPEFVCGKFLAED